MPGISAKELVIIAGARQHGIQEFFHRFAPSLEINTKKSDALGDWKWPVLQEDDFDVLRSERTAAANISRYDIFELLFERKRDSVVQNILMEAIRNSWKNSTQGIILGGERFGKIGENPFTSDDALKTIYRLIENLSIRSKDVTLILIYDTPRIEQWAYIWREKSSSVEYFDFLCGSSESDLRYEFIDTIMNPLKLAIEYRKHGWKVMILDEEGIRRSGLDPSHSIACNVLGVNCDQGWITGLKEEISIPPPSYDINGLNEIDKDELEKLFLLRDCYYEDDLEFQSRTKEFQIVNKQSIWENCKKRQNDNLREKIIDANFFLNAIQSQKSCEHDFVNLSDLLNSTSTSNFNALLWFIVFASFIFIIAAAGVFFIRNNQGKNIHKKIGSLYRGVISRKSDSTKNPPPSDINQGAKFLCNACKFVRFDPNCIFCQDGRRLSSSEIGREVERRIKQQQQQQRTNISAIVNKSKDDNDTCVQVSGISRSLFMEGSKTGSGTTPSSPSISTASSDDIDLNSIWTTKTPTYENFPATRYINTSHFDMNLRNTRGQSRKKKRQKPKIEQKQKSQVVRKLKELLVLKTESGERVYKLTETSNSFSSGHNLQTISLEEDEKIFV